MKPISDLLTNDQVIAKKEALKILIESFEKTDYKAQSEMQIRANYIDPFLEILGWDVQNKAGNKGNHIEVKRDMRKSKSNLLPDYTISFCGNVYFYVEAKDPKIDLTSDKSSAYQIKKYMWHTKQEISILTDFEEFSIYTCKNTPKESDIVTKDRITYFRCEDYLEKFEFLYETFSKDAVVCGNFEEYAELHSGSKTNKNSIDKEFVKFVEKIRDILIEDILESNEVIANLDITTAVSKIINRFLFLKFAEDNHFDYPQAKYIKKETLEKKSIWKTIDKLFTGEIDARYNSGLFASDPVISAIKISDEGMKTILSMLMENDFDFSIIPISIIGRIYENFLTSPVLINQQKEDEYLIEIKKQYEKAKKENGIVYTPEIITNFINKTCLEKFKIVYIENKILKYNFPKVLDPACGSGAFLINMYENIVSKILDEINANKRFFDLAKKTGIISLEGDKIISLRLYHDILLNCIYGNDKDAQAVEITKFSLYLTMMRFLNKSIMDIFINVTNGKFLPTIDKNIVCSDALLEYIPPCKMDIVIGNPPYVRAEKIISDKDLLQKKYESVVSGNCDLYIYFFKLAMDFLNQDGVCGFITSNKWKRANYGQKLREYLLANTKIISIFDLYGCKIFEKVSVDAAITILEKTIPEDNNRFKYVEGIKNLPLSEVVLTLQSTTDTFLQKEVSAETYYFSNQKILNIHKKIQGNNRINISKSMSGIKTGGNDIFIIDEKTRNNFIQNDSKNASILKPVLYGENIKRYQILPDKKWIIFSHNGTKDESKIDIVGDYPAIHSYFIQKNLESEDKFKNRADQGSHWTNLRPCAYINDFSLPKIIFPDICAEASFTYDDSGFVLLSNAYFITEKDSNYPLKYLLGLLNSKLLTFIYKKFYMGGGLGSKGIRYIKCNIEKLPIANCEEKTKQKIIQLVDRVIIDKKSGKNTAGTESIIDNLVYDIYGITMDERILIEKEMM